MAQERRKSSIARLLTQEMQRLELTADDSYREKHYCGRNMFIGLFPNPVTGDEQETNNQNNHQQIVSFLKPKFIAVSRVLFAFVRIGWSYMEFSCLQK